MVGVAPTIQRVWRLFDKLVRGRIHQIVWIPYHHASRISAILRSGGIHILAVSHRNVPGPVIIGRGHDGPGIRSEVECGAAIGSPTLAVKRNLQPGCSGTPRDIMNTERLAGRGRGPIRIALRHTVNLLVVYVDELAGAGADRIHTINFRVTVLR